MTQRVSGTQKENGPFGARFTNGAAGLGPTPAPVRM